jgi:hypothetical protein
MCEAKMHNHEDYRIELPYVDEHIFAAALSYMYNHFLKDAVDQTLMMEGDALGNLYVFASKYGMKRLRYAILEDLVLGYQTAPTLLEAAKIVYEELGGDELFRLFFVEHIVERLCSFRSGQPEAPNYQQVQVAEWAAEGGLFGSDLTEAMLAALLDKRLLLMAIQQPRSVPLSYYSGCGGSVPLDRPMVRKGTAIALRDWDGGNFSKLSFREGDRITEVVGTESQSCTTALIFP